MASVYASKPWLRHYPSYVPEELPLPEKSMIDIFEETVRNYPDRPAVYYFNQVMTFAQLNDMADRFAAVLAEWGVGKGDRVAVYLQNNPQFMVAQYGAWKRGAAIVPLNPMFKEKELDYHLNDSGAKVLVCLDSLFESYAQGMIDRTPVQYVAITNEMELRGEAVQKHPVSSNSSVKVVDLLEAVKDVSVKSDIRQSVTPDDIAYLVYTSGTTGQPKGAMNWHRNIAFNAEVYRTWMQIDEKDAILAVAPLFHITGIVGHVALSALAGIPMVLFHRFETKTALKMIEKWRPTMTVGAITVYIAIMNDPDAGQCDLSSLVKCYSGGAPIPPSLTERFEEKFGVYIHNIYGLTETNSPTHAVPYGKRAPVDPKSGALSVGVPIPNAEVKLVDIEGSGDEVPVGQTGEFLVRGPMVFAGYWNKPSETEKALQNGFFATGDIVSMDEEGWFYVVDRKKDMINASGFKVWPREVEDVLYQHPAVKEASVVGVPDAYRGETVKAYVALKGAYKGKVTEEDLIAFCKARMAAYKYPRQIAFMDELPKTATGKFLRRELRELAKKESSQNE